MVSGGQDKEDVVLQGTPKWDETKVVGTGMSRTGFAISVDSLSEEKEQVISTPRVTGAGACAPQVVTQIPANKKLTPEMAVTAEVRYRCEHQGTCVVSMEVPLFPEMAPYRPVRWSWTKLCGGSALGIDVETEEDGEVVKVSTDGASNASSDVFMDKKTEQQTVWLVNDEERSSEPEVHVRMLRVACLDSIHCSAHIGVPPMVLKSTEATPVAINYTCWTSGTSLVQLFLETEGHDPITVTWAKECSVFADSFGGVMSISFVACITIACSFLGCMSVCCKDPSYVEGYGEEGTGPAAQEAAGEDTDEED